MNSSLLGDALVADLNATVVSSSNIEMNLEHGTVGSLPLQTSLILKCTKF